MAEKREKLPSFVTPKGTFKWPRLTEPDTKFKDAGEYSVKLLLPAAEAQELSDKLQPLHDEAVKAGKKAWAAMSPPVQNKFPFKVNEFSSPDYDEDGEETGLTEFNFKMTASGVVKKTGKPWKRKPAIFDAKGKPIKGALAIWGGTVGKVSFEVMPFFVAVLGAGLSLRLQAVQIIELVQGGQKEARGYGFGEEEGYEVEDTSADNDDDADAAADGGEDDAEGDF